MFLREPPPIGFEFSRVQKCQCSQLGDLERNKGFKKDARDGALVIT